MDAQSSARVSASARAARFTVNHSHDALEHAADALAARALNRSSNQASRRESLGSRGAPGAAPPWLCSAGRPLEPAVRRDFEARFDHDFSRVRVHVDAAAAESAQGLNSLAYSVGSHLVFSNGAYAPGTASGRSLLAHELAHTVQADQGLARDRIQPRRVPSQADTDAALPPATDTVGVMNARTGLARVLTRAWVDLNAADRATVRTAAAGFAITFTDEATLSTALGAASRDQLVAFATQIRTVRPNLQLGDPALINTGPRNATDTANIKTLVDGAHAVFTTLAGTTRDTDITQVFGASNLTTVKTNYKEADAAMLRLKAANKIVTDRSGYNAEVGLGGLSGPSQIALSPETIDNPSEKESIITLIHESMHAAGVGIGDDAGYISTIGPALFVSMSEAQKLVTAAHYEVVPRRIKGAANDFAGQTFVPAGTTVGTTTAPALTSQEQAVNDASNEFREAWTAGLHLHEFWVRLLRTPTEWSTLDLATEFGAPAGVHFSDAMPFWSKVELLTVHTRFAQINPAGAPAVRPVTMIDIALSEEVTRRLSQAMNATPQSAAQAQTLETRATAAERTAAAASAAVEKQLILKLVLRDKVGSITGPADRDVRVVNQMATGSRGAYAAYLQSRSPASFA